MIAPNAALCPSPLAQAADCRPVMFYGPGGIFLAARSDGSLPPDRLRAGIVNCLRQAAGGIVLRAELIDWLYGDDPDGGPDDPQGVIDVVIWRLQTEQSIPIKIHKARGYSYRATRREYCDEPGALPQ